ncbi:MAG: TonB-dependent receptor plug domain-containing protein [Candidatus Binatia bacterium]
MRQTNAVTRRRARMTAIAAVVALCFVATSGNADRAIEAGGENLDAQVPVPESEFETAPTELAPILIDANKVEENALVERSFETPDDIAGFGETIFAEPSWRSFQTTAELLGQSVGAQIRRQGGRDDFSTLSIRGAPSAQVRILLDGVALGRASDSVVNLADLPIDTIDRIEVYRGFAPVSLTPVSAAGVVNVITRDPGHATGSVAVGGGSFGTAKVNAGGAGPVAGGSAAAFASYRHTDGDFDYVNDNGTPEKKADDSVRKRENNESDTVENLLRWRSNLTDDLKLQIRNHLFYKDEGVPGVVFYDPNAPPLLPKSRLETVRDIAALGLGSRDGRWNAEQIVTWESQKLSDTGSPSADNTSETTASTTAVRWGRPLPAANWFSGSAEYTWEGFDQRNPSSPNAEANRSSLAIAAGDDWTVSALRTTFSMQLRHQELWNDSNDESSGDSSDRSTDPRVGLRWEPLGGLAIKSNVSTYFRPPSFDELFGSNGFTTANPALTPEEGLTWDAGFEWTGRKDPFGKLAISYSYFGSNIDDVIVVVLTFDRTAKAVNETRARIRGHEARVEWQGPAGFALSANYTHQDAENRASAAELRGKELAGLASNEGWVRVSWGRGPVVLAYDVDITGAHFTDSENHEPLPSRSVHNVSTVLGPFWKGWRLTLEANNLGDSLVPDQIGFPLPGRSFFAVVSWSMPPKTGESNAH